MYTMIGRGILSEKTKMMIQDGIEMLINKYPNDQRYTDALEMTKDLKIRFR